MSLNSTPCSRKAHSSCWMDDITTPSCQPSAIFAVNSAYSFGFRCRKQASSISAFQLHMPNLFAKGANISIVSCAMPSRFTSGRASKVLKLCRRSASLIKTTRTSTIARNIVLRRSASSGFPAVSLSLANWLKVLTFETWKRQAQTINYIRTIPLTCSLPYR
jgi:hypothetical protein